MVGYFNTLWHRVGKQGKELISKSANKNSLLPFFLFVPSVFKTPPDYLAIRNCLKFFLTLNRKISSFIIKSLNSTSSTNILAGL